jgi:DNA-binding winged helix-turn-helix (wHTH) protein/Tol biopolymer transport system component
MPSSASSPVPQTPSIRGYHVGRFHIDLPTRQLLRDGEAIPISARAWDALVMLLAQRARVVPKEELISHVWPDKTVSDDVLPQTILTIRRALGDDSVQPRFVATIPRRGYRFIAPAVEIPLAGGEDTTAPLPAPPQDPPPVPSHHRYTITAIAAAIVCAIAAGTATWMLLLAQPSAATPARALRFTQSTPAGTVLVAEGALSPDGHSLAFVTEDDQTSQSRLWMRALNAEDAQVLTGTEGARRPFWSPDSRSIGFFVNDRLKVYSLDTGTTQAVLTVGLSPAGASWNSRGQILFASWRSGLRVVPAGGGTVTTVTSLDVAAREVAHQSPQFLPDGEHFLYYVVGANPESNGTYLGQLGGGAPTRLVDGAAEYAAPGYLIWTRDGALLAQRFDAGRRRLEGAVQTLAANVGTGALVSTAGEDLLAFGGGSAPSRFVWFNRQGERLDALTVPTPFHNPALSTDRHFLVASSGGETEQRGVWMVDLERGAPTRLVSHGNSPLFSPDGSTIVYTSDQMAGVADVYRSSASGRDETLLLKTNENKIVNDWSPDGRYLVFVSTNPDTKKDVWLLPANGGPPVPYLRTRFNEIQGRISPDGHWMAYASDESGEWEVYVQSFPSPGHKQIVSVGGGAQPNWRNDGRELFYLAPNHALMSVDVAGGDTLTISRPHVLFRTPITGGLNTFRSHYVVDDSGTRFLLDVRERTPGSESIGVVVNWRAMLGGKG